VPITTLEPTTSHKRLRVFAAITAILAILQTVVAVTMMGVDSEVVVMIHEGLGFLFAASAIATAVPAFVWGRLSHNTGLIGHAAGIAVAGVVQLLLGIVGAPEDGAPMGPMIYVHMALGLLILVGSVALYVLAKKQPIIVTNVDGTPRG
jgi:hypothetical protein